MLLVLRALGLGDLLTGVPALRGLRRAYPEHRLVLAAPSPLRPLLPLIGGVDALLDVSGPGPVPLHAPDIAVNLHGRGPESTAALLRTAPARLLSHAPPNRTGLRAMRLMREIRGVRGPRWREDVHEVRRWCDMLAWFGVPADPADLDIAAPPETAREAEAPVVIHPGAAYPARRWPPSGTPRSPRPCAAPDSGWW
ncbi:glycosyltransferase family 9 protein [Thermocatellispora tengchongensis]|uniref:glycosyltransferase family 9 protein n=1 Tax=Thermocatellispora tengchongensis TaxID=1073253 RepID=UPI0036343BDB